MLDTNLYKWISIHIWMLNSSQIFPFWKKKENSPVASLTLLKNKLPLLFLSSTLLSVIKCSFIWRTKTNRKNIYYAHHFAMEMCFTKLKPNNVQSSSSWHIRTHLSLVHLNLQERSWLPAKMKREPWQTEVSCIMLFNGQNWHVTGCEKKNKLKLKELSTKTVL